jgi:hypothetical protein
VSAAEDQSLINALRVVRSMLPIDRQASEGEVEEAVNLVHGMLAMRGEQVERSALLRKVQELVTVFQEDATGIFDDSPNHRPWLPDAKAQRKWEFWDRYRDYTENVLMLPPRVVRTLDRSTDDILGDLEDPQRPRTWRRAGLVIGQVQSGKTGNYTGLACKAADAGYKLIIILAGIHNDLRSQTQLRIDQGLLGFDTQYQKRYDEDAKRYIGVGAMSHVKRLSVGSLTDSTEKGDFHRDIAQRANFSIGHFPIVLVIKKHRSIINNVRQWLVDVTDARDDKTGRELVRDIPLLLIDDEADHAGIDVSKTDETDPSKVNGQIRKLLNSFEKAAYVGYTATPFANILIDPDADHPEFGRDLFPDSFVHSLPAPSNYFGPERVFGLRLDDPDEDDVEPLPVIRRVEDFQAWMPDKHRSSWQIPDGLPASLRQAINAFVLACAARRARGQNAYHNSMLVHVTRFNAVQLQVMEEIDDYVRLLTDSLRDRYGRASALCVEELRQLWHKDFVRTSEAFPAEEVPAVSWTEVAEHLMPAVQKIQVRAINGAAKDALEYYENRKTGLSVIAVGGEKLSRGLTLEGLSVSYYLRAAKAYDTLLQMGRWFGYRPGYEDLCRLYTTDQLRNAYVEITRATDELRREVEEMAALREKPVEFGLKVRASSLGLTVTASNKMRNGTRVKLSFSGEAPETVIFDLDEDVVRRNLKTLEEFVQRLDSLGAATQKDQGGSVVWKDVQPEDILSFLDGYMADSSAQRVRPAFIAEYIRRCTQAGELSHWTVRLVGKSNAGAVTSIGNHEVGLITRAATNDPNNERRQTIRRVISPADESTDLTKDQWESALATTRKAAKGKLDKNGQPRNPKVPTGFPLRRVRTANQALLLIYPLVPPSVGDQDVPLVGFAISFPESAKREQTEYVVNEIWRKEQINLDDDEDGS